MNQQLIDQLYADHPRMFDRYSSIECWDGWYILIDQICRYLSHNATHLEQMAEYHIKCGANPTSSIVQRYKAEIEHELENFPVVTQVKEKFGLLRFYTTHLNEHQQIAIDAFEYISGRICEQCGTMHGTKLYTNVGWIKALCPDHAAEFYGDRLKGTL